MYYGFPYLLHGQVSCLHIQLYCHGPSVGMGTAMLLFAVLYVIIYLRRLHYLLSQATYHRVVQRRLQALVSIMDIIAVEFRVPAAAKFLDLLTYLLRCE